MPEPLEAGSAAPVKGKAHAPGLAISIVAAAGHRAHGLPASQGAARAPEQNDVELGTQRDGKVRSSKHQNLARSVNVVSVPHALPLRERCDRTVLTPLRTVGHGFHTM